MLCVWVCLHPAINLIHMFSTPKDVIPVFQTSEVVYNLTYMVSRMQTAAETR